MLLLLQTAIAQFRCPSLVLLADPGFSFTVKPGKNASAVMSLAFFDPCWFSLTTAFSPSLTKDPGISLSGNSVVYFQRTRLSGHDRYYFFFPSAGAVRARGVTVRISGSAAC